MSHNPPSLRYYDAARDRLATASPSLLMVWQGQKPGVVIAGPHILIPRPRTHADLFDAYVDWMAAGEPA